MVRSLLRYEQVRRRGAPDVQADDAPFAEGRYFEASCPSSIVVNDCVLVIGTNGGGRPKIKKVDPSDPAAMPAVGMVVEKASPQVCLVQVSGLVTSLSGLVAGFKYYVGAGGVPVTPEPETALKQLVGVALGASKLLLFPNQSTGVSGGSGGVIVADIDPALASEVVVGTLVQFAEPTGALPLVRPADPTDSTKTPAIGVVVSKPSSSTCVLVLTGVVTIAGVSDLVPGRPCFVWYDGRPYTTYPGNYASPSGYVMVQTLGVAVSSSAMALNPDMMRVKVYTSGKPAPPLR